MEQPKQPQENNDTSPEMMIDQEGILLTPGETKAIKKMRAENASWWREQA